MSAELDLLSLERQVCFALAVASRNVISIYRPLLEPMGLTHPQYLVLLALWGRSPRSVKDLSQVLQLEPATLSPLLKRLEAAELIIRSRDESDERSLAITLTDKGLHLRDEAARIPPQVIERLGMPLTELQDLQVILMKVIAATQK